LTVERYDVQLNAAPLEGLIQNLDAAENAYLKVGILGDYAGRTPDETGTKRKDSDLTNPQLGLWHEFGSKKVNLPERSFLRMPILLHLGDKLKSMASPEQWKDIIVKHGFIHLLDMVGNECIGLIADAFHTGGFGFWEKLKPRTIARKKNSDILIDTGQLQRSITYAVVLKGSPQTPVAPLP